MRKEATYTLFETLSFCHRASKIVLIMEFV